MCESGRCARCREWGPRAIQALPSAALVVDSHGHVVLANACAAAVLQHSVEALVGVPVEAILAPIEVMLRPTNVDDLRSEISVRRPDGTTITVGYSLNSFVPDESAGELHHVVLFRDLGHILELRRERDRLLQHAAVGSALPSLLHEIRNPLAGVITALEVLLEETPEGELQETLHAVLTEVRRVQLGLQGLGTVGRDLATYDFAAIDHALEETCRVMAPTAARAGVQLRAEVEALPLLPFDPAVLRGLAFNLLTNAIAACRPGDEIELSARLEGERLRVSVRDTGTGMTPEVLARCTELFFTTRPRGSGIGLALCKRTAEAVGGTLAVVSAPGAGTTVSLELPLPDRAARQRLAPRRPTPPPSRAP